MVLEMDMTTERMACILQTGEFLSVLSLFSTILERSNQKNIPNIRKTA